jgi:hypothetical protein
VYAWDIGQSPDDLPLTSAPAWLLARLRLEPRRGGEEPVTLQAKPTAALVRQALFTIPNDDAPYDIWLKIGMALHSLGEDWAGDLWELWSQQSPKYTDVKQEKAWASFTQGGKVQIDNLFALARKHGWQVPSAYTQRTPGARAYLTRAETRPSIFHKPMAQGVPVWQA